MATRFRLRIRNAILDDRVVPIAATEVVVGRGEHADIFLEDSSISRFHARLQVRGSELLVTDLESRNGTFVNGERVVSPQRVGPATELRFGTLVCIVELDLAASGGAPSRIRQFLDARKSLLLIAGLSVFAALAAVAVLLQETLADVATPTAAPTTSNTTPARSTEPPAEAPRVQEVPQPAGNADPAASSGEPDASDAPQPEPPVDAEPAPPLQRVDMLDGTLHSGTVIPGEDPEVLLLHPASGGEPLRLDALTIARVDGKTWTPDIARIAAVRGERARNPSALRVHMQWCREHALPQDERKTAERLLQLDAHADDALAALGRGRLRGAVLELAELKARGLVDAEGLLTGPREDAGRITAWYFDLLGRAPLARELDLALKGTDESLVDALLASAAHAEHVLGSHLPALRTRPFPDDLAGQLASGALSLLDALRAAALTIATGTEPPQERATAVLCGMLPAAQAGERALIDAASHMLAGERTAIFGERGANATELVAILGRQPGFFRKTLEVESARCLGARANADGLKKAIFRVASEASALTQLRREWLLGNERRTAPERSMTPEQRCAAAIALGCNRIAEAAEIDKLLVTSASLGGEGTGPLPVLLIDFPPPATLEHYLALIACTLARPATEAEKALFTATPVTERGALVAALFVNPAWGRYGP